MSVFRFLLALVFVCLLTGWARPGFAVAILHGDIVAITAENQGLRLGTGSLVHIDPVTGAKRVISTRGFVDVGLTRDGRIFAVTPFELVEVQPGTGDLRIIRDLSDLGTARALAVSPTGGLFVAYEDLATRRSGIVAIDPVSGAGSSVSSLGSFGRMTDLEFVAGDKLATLAEKPGGDRGELPMQIIDAITGISILTGTTIVQGHAEGGALGVSAAGDLVAWAALGLQGTGAWALMAGTGQTIRLNLPLYNSPDDETCIIESGDCTDQDLYRSDVAYLPDGRLLLSVNGRTGSPPWTRRLFTVDADGTGHVVTDGAFSEVQVMVPEPSTALLLLAGLLGLVMASERTPASRRRR